MTYEQRWYMEDYLRKKYGEYIRGRKVTAMPDEQILAIFSKVSASEKLNRGTQIKYNKFFARKLNKKAQPDTPLEQQMTIEDLFKEAANV